MKHLFLLFALLLLLVLPISTFAQDPAPVPTEALETVLQAVEEGQPVVVIQQPAPVDPVETEPALYEQARDAAYLAFWGFVVLVLVILGVAVAGQATLVIRQSLKSYLNADTKLVAFGQSPTGRLIHSGLGTLGSYVDSPSDPLIMQGTTLGNQVVLRALTIFDKVLPIKAELLTPEEVSEAAKVTLGGLKELFNGIPLPSDITPETLRDHLKAQG
jgi:Na+-transporting methylmalonyl-CoA/oxaloacetate decarboxylase gamma subunit